MEAALQVFLITIAILGGILSPLIIIALIGSFGSTMNALTKALEIKLEEIKKAPPFDDVEVNVSPATRVMSMRFIKNDVVIWAGSATQNANDEKLEFTTETLE